MPTIQDLKRKHEKDGEYECDICHGIFKLNPEWDAEAEAKDLWGDSAKRDDQLVFCDDCFNKFMDNYKD